MGLVKYNDLSISSISDVSGSDKSMILIKEQTASSSDDISFVDGTSDVVLDNTYPIYVFKLINLHPSNDQTILRIFASIDTGSNYNAYLTASYFYAGNLEAGTATFFTIETRGGGNATGGMEFSDTLGADADQALSGEFWLFNPSSTTFIKNFMGRTNTAGDDNQSNDVFSSGYVNSTSAVDAIKFAPDAGTIDSGSIKLYGIKDS